MAKMHPVDIENYNYTYSEKTMYNALKEQLPDKYEVFYSVRWFDYVKGRRIDSESDFVIFDPSFGYITVEVKGGISIEVDNGKWLLHERDKSGNESSRGLKCSPYEQAEKSMRYFHKYFYSEFNQSFNGAYGFAVAFPRYRVDEKISNDAPLDLTIDMNDMNDLHSKVNRIFHYWKNKRNISVPFSQSQKARFISILNKRVALSAAAGALIPIKEKELAKINFVQDSILDAFHNYSQIRIVGGAGTGKTFIGMKKAIRESMFLRDTLFTCCSEELVKFVKSQIPEGANVHCIVYRDLIKKVLGEQYHSINKGSDGKIHCFDYSEDIAYEDKYDSIIVDEAQDFTTEMGLSIRSLLRDEVESSLYVFEDQNQNIFSIEVDNPFLIEYPPVVLRYNIRNTACIHDFASTNTDLGKEIIPNTLFGVKPEYYEYKRKNQTKITLTNIVNRLVQKEEVLTSSIVILSDEVFERSVLANEEYVGAFRIDKLNDNDIIEDAIRFRTVEEFKGLEADVVIYLMHTLTRQPRTKKVRCNQYVALTRARYYLYILNTKIKSIIGE